jgi:ABC-2 type transport system permease protein
MTGKALVVAKFEFTKTIRRKGFILGTLGLPVLMLLVLGLSFYSGTGFSTTSENQTVGFVDGAGFLQASSGYIPYTNMDAGRNALLKGDINSLVVVPQDYLRAGTVTVYTMDTSLMGSAGASQSVQDFIAENLLRYGNVSDTIAQKILKPETPKVLVLDASGNPKGDQALTGFVLPFALTMLLAVGILTSSGYLMQGIGEEKEGRRGEFLLSHCSAEQLLAGKILG